MSIKDKLISNSIFLILFRFSDAIMFMVFWLILGRAMIPASYGIVALSLEIVSLVSSVGLVGMSAMVNKLIPELLKTEKKDELQGVIYCSLAATLAASVLLSLGFVVTSVLAPDLIKLDFSTMSLTAVAAVMAAMAVLSMNIHLGFQSTKRIFVTSFVSSLTMVALAFLSIRMNFGYTGAIIAFLAGSVILFVTRLEKRFFTFSKHPAVNTARIIKFAGPAFVVSLFTVLANNTQAITLTIMENTTITGLFAVAMKIAFVLSVPSIISRGLFPILSELSVDKSSEPKQSRLISLTFRYEAFMLFTAAALLIVFQQQLLLFFSNPDFMPALQVLPAVVLANMFLSFSDHFLSSLYAIGEPEKYRNANLISTVAYLALSIALTYYFSLIGMAIAYLVYSILLTALSYSYIRKSCATLRLPLKSTAKILISLAISVSPLVFLQSMIPNVWIAIPFIVASMVVNVLVLSKLGFFIQEDLKILDYGIERMPIFKKEAYWLRVIFAKLVNIKD